MSIKFVERRKVKIYRSRTPKDEATLRAMIDCGWTNDQIFTYMGDPTWRSQCLEVGGTTYCEICAQPIRLEVCNGCGQGVDNE